MNLISYFSSTGNSLYIAKYLENKIGGDIFYILNSDVPFDKYDKMILVTPVYSFGLPIPVVDFISSITSTDLPIYIVLNYGGMTGNADYFAYSLCKKHSLNIKGVYSVQMPENFTLTFTQPKFFMNFVLNKAPKKIDKIADKIKNDRQRHIKEPKRDKTTEKYLKNKSNWHKISDDFSVNDDCIKCKKCINICPADNITMSNGKIQFKDKCIACLGCYHRCPKKAISYKNKRKRDRYINPKIEENQIGKSNLQKGGVLFD